MKQTLCCNYVCLEQQKNRQSKTITIFFFPIIHFPHIDNVSNELFEDLTINTSFGFHKRQYYIFAMSVNLTAF